jgi:hypothetical protein
MNKFQPVSFPGFNDLYALLPKPEFEIVKTLRLLSIQCIPHVKEKLSYNAPYHHINEQICLIILRSVIWGGTVEEALLRFANAKSPADEWNNLKWAERKTVGTKTYFDSMQVIKETDIIKMSLIETAEIDSHSKNRKS